MREERNVRRPRPGHRLPPAGDDCPDTGDEPPGPVTATVDVGPGYLPGSPAPVTVDDGTRLDGGDGAVKEGSGAPPAATALRPHRRAKTPLPRS